MRKLPVLIFMFCFGVTSAIAQETGQNQPKKENPDVVNPGGDWVNWNEVQKQYSTDWLEKITDPTAKAEAGKVVGREQEARSDALADFKKGAGLGISIALGSEQNSIDEAKVVDQKIVVTRRSKDQPRAALEVHQLFTTNIFTSSGRKAQREQSDACGADPRNCPLWGVGPFAAIQIGDDSNINSVGVGFMVGVRSNPRRDASFNIGLGVVIDAHVNRLAPGFKDGDTLPTGQTSVPLVEKSSRRPLLTLSFAF